MIFPFCYACETRTDWLLYPRYHMSTSARAARRFKKQIFLSIDMPPSLGSMGQEGKLLLAIERALVDILRSAVE